MKPIHYVTTLLLSLFMLAVPAYAETIALQESYSVEIPNLKVELDNGKYDITANVTWHFKQNARKEDYIDSNLVVNDIKSFLAHYPNKKDFWEVINHQLALFLVKKYPAFKSMTIKLNVPASMFDPYAHYSLVTVGKKLDCSAAA